MQNYVSIHEQQTKPNPALAAVHGQAALLLRHDVSNCYVSPKLLGIVNQLGDLTHLLCNTPARESPNNIGPRASQR
jgi:hypothetical protein